MLNCPKCGSPRIHRSRSRNAWERLRKAFTHHRLHRCHACGWRGWGTVSSASARADCTAGKARPAPNLEAIDLAVEQAQNRDDSK